MTKIADLLDLPREGQDRLWVVASNGAVIFRYPPLEVVHEETFDASEAVRQVLEQHPEALVAVEERGVGYRVNRPFPDGELSGEMIETELHEIVGEPVSRVIIRDPTASADDFVAMAARLGLHGTDYVVGWTAWLDLVTRRGLQGLRAAVRRRHLGLVRRATPSPSATAATTSRCCAGPAAGWPWARPSRRSTRPPTPPPRRLRRRRGAGTPPLVSRRARDALLDPGFP